MEELKQIIEEYMQDNECGITEAVEDFLDAFSGVAEAAMTLSGLPFTGNAVKDAITIITFIKGAKC